MVWLAGIAILATLLWGLVVLRAAGSWSLTPAALIAGTVVGYPFFHVSAFTSDRVLLLFAVTSSIVSILHGRAPRFQWTRSDVVLLAYLLAMTAATFSHPWQLDGGAPLSKFLFAFAVPVAYYCVARLHPPSGRQLLGLMIGLSAFGLYLAATAIAEKFEFYSLVFPRYIVDPAYSEFLGRGRGPLLNPSGNGILITIGMSATFCIGWYFRGAYRWLAWITLPIFAMGAYATLTRCVWLGAAGAMVYLMMQRIPKSYRVAFLTLIVLGAGSLVLLKSQQLTSFKRDKNVSVADMQQSAQLRPILAVVAWKMFLDRPLTGCGIGQYLENSRYYLLDRDIDVPLEKVRQYVQHNVFLAMLAEAGLLGLAPYVAMFGFWIGSAFQLIQRSFAGSPPREFGHVLICGFIAYFANGMFQDVMLIPSIHDYFFFLAGTAVLLTQNSARRTGSEASVATRSFLQETVTCPVP